MSVTNKTILSKIGYKPMSINTFLTPVIAENTTCEKVEKYQNSKYRNVALKSKKNKLMT